MILYFSIAFGLFCLALAVLVGIISKRYEKPLVFCLTLLAYAFSFIRWDTGTDWLSYIQMYEGMTTMQAAREQDWWGPGYAYLAVLANSLGADFTVFLFFIATLLFGIKYLLLTRSSSAPLVAVFVLFCTSFYDIYFVRQNLAVIFFWAFAYYFFRKEYALAVGAAALATMFHYSALAPIAIVVAITNLDWKKITAGGLVAAGSAYLLFSLITISDILSLTTLTSYIGNEYVEVKSSALNTTTRSYIKLLYWLLVIICSHAWFLRRSVPEQATDWNSYCVRSAFGILLLAAILLPVSEVFSRLPVYALPLFAIVLSNYRFRLNNISVGSAAYIVTLLLLFAQLWFLYGSYPESYYPVKTIFG